MIETIVPKDKEHWLSLRTQDITSTEVSALFGLSPYMTEFELWHRKKDNIFVEFAENERTEWGTALEEAIAKKIAEKEGWTIRAMKEYVRNPQLKMGSSFDFSIEGKSGNDLTAREIEESWGILEIKNVDSLQFRNTWIKDDDKNIEAPSHIELQIQHQLELTSRKFAYIGALVGGNRLELIRREANQDIAHAIVEKIHQFWESISAGCAPTPDFTRDADFISKTLYGYAEPGKHIDTRGDQRIADLCAQYRAFGDAEKQAGSQKAALKAQILTILGDAEKAQGDGFKISAGIIAKGEYTVHPKPYRDFRINWTKGE